MTIGSVLIVAEEVDLLLAVFVEDVKVVFGQIGNEAAFVVGYGDGDDNVVDRDLDGVVLRACAPPRRYRSGRARGYEIPAQHA